MKKVLLLSVTAGQGHNSTAQAIANYLKDNDVECFTLDTYKHINTILGTTIDKGYNITTSHAPTAYRYAYRAFEMKRKSGKMSLPYFINSIFAKKLSEYIINYNPDVIVCTHSFTAALCSVLKEHGKLKCKTIGIVTDYTIHPFWEDSGSIDYYVLANELLYNQAVKKGLSSEKLLPYGIPIRPAFSEKLEKKEARTKLGINTDKFTILVMGGGTGYGKIDRIVSSVDKLHNLDFQILAVCGKNVRMKKKVERLRTKNDLHIYGFVDNINIMMDAADCIITKPGGLTTSEALAKRLPIIMINPIPGQEDRNVEFLLNNGLAMLVSKTFPVDECIYELFQNPKRLELMSKIIEMIGKPTATKDLCEFIINILNE